MNEILYLQKLKLYLIKNLFFKIQKNTFSILFYIFKLMNIVNEILIYSVVINLEII
jgi:hypothetical protein